MTLRLLLLLALPLALAPEAAAQEASALRVAYDCQTRGCDRDFFQTELPYVQFVRDQGDADVFVLITGDRTGSGGRRYSLFFQGRGGFADEEKTLTVSTSLDATDDDERRAIASRLSLGLATFVARTPLADRLTVVYDGPAAGEAATPEAEQDDPWNGWTFRTRANSFFRGESRQSSFNGNGRLSADRVTDLWKLEVDVFGNYGRDTFESTTDAGDDTTFVSERSGYGGGVLLVRSLGDRLSAGLQVSASSNTFSNYRARVVGGPGVEVSLFPYDEVTRRLVTASYSLGLEVAAYRDTTIFGVIDEVLPQHSARVGAELAQPWGSVNVELTAQQYLSQLDKYQVGLGGGINVRLARGLQLNLGGNASLIENQLSLSAEGLTTEEILTRQEQQATSFRYFGNVGISYAFGSIFNAVVNPRFSEGGGVIIIG